MTGKEEKSEERKLKIFLDWNQNLVGETAKDVDRKRMWEVMETLRNIMDQV